MAQPITRLMTDAEKAHYGVAGHPDRNELAEAINQGLQLHQIAQRYGRQVIDIAIMFKQNYANNLKLPGLSADTPILLHYATLKREAIKLCAKAGIDGSPPIPTRNPHKPPPRTPSPPAAAPEARKEEPPVTQPAGRKGLTREYLAEQLKTRTVSDIAQEHGISEPMLYVQLREFGLSAREIRKAAGIKAPHHQRKPTQAALSEAPAPVSQSEAPPSDSTPDLPNGSDDHPNESAAPGSGAGRGIPGDDLPFQSEGEGGTVTYSIDPSRLRVDKLLEDLRALPPVPTFACQITESAIDINLSDKNLTPAQVRQYMRVVEGNLELAGEGLELQLTIRGPRR